MTPKTKGKTKKPIVRKDPDIKLFGPEVMKPRRGGGEKYIKYITPVKEYDYVNWLNTNIADSPDGKLRMRIAEWADAIDMKISVQNYDGGKDPHSIYWGSKFALYVTGPFVVEIGKNKADEPMLIIAHAPPGYQLPKSLKDKLTEEEIQMVYAKEMEAIKREAADAKKREAETIKREEEAIKRKEEAIKRKDEEAPKEEAQEIAA